MKKQEGTKGKNIFFEENIKIAVANAILFLLHDIYSQQNVKIRQCSFLSFVESRGIIFGIGFHFCRIMLYLFRKECRPGRAAVQL